MTELQLQSLWRLLTRNDEDKWGMKEKDPVKRLNNLCDWLAKQKDESPYSQEAWKELENENARLRVELAQIIRIHEELAREYSNYKIGWRP
jgi:hypothetical protein